MAQYLFNTFIFPSILIHLSALFCEEHTFLNLVFSPSYFLMTHVVL